MIALLHLIHHPPTKSRITRSRSSRSVRWTVWNGSTLMWKPWHFLVVPILTPPLLVFWKFYQPRKNWVYQEWSSRYWAFIVIRSWPKQPFLYSILLILLVKTWNIALAALIFFGACDATSMHVTLSTALKKDRNPNLISLDLMACQLFIL